MEFKGTFKKSSLIINAIVAALQMESRSAHLVLTTGNIISYDYTFEFLAEIGDALSQHDELRSLKHLLPTLMPPGTLGLKNKMIERLIQIIMLYQKSSSIIPQKSNHI